MRRLITLLLVFIPLMLGAQKPLIGISCGHSSSKSTVSDTYVNAVMRAGGIPVALPVMTDSAVVAQTLALLDGLVITGGEDVDPQWYGEQEDPECHVGINALRDTSDIILVRAAVREGLPVLGICRGEQVINVALGGTLYQDLPYQLQTPFTHKQKESGRTPTQTMVVAADSYIGRLLGGRETLEINSMHHQAVKQLAPGLSIAGWTWDGVVEAYEGFPQYNIVALQFHPEALSLADDYYLVFFKDLLERCKTRKHE